MPDSFPPFDSDNALDGSLRRLHDLPPVAPRPFFYARVQARLAQAEAPGARLPLLWWLRRPAYLAVAFVLLLILNAGAMLYYAQQLTGTSVAATTATYSAFTSEYQLTPYVVDYE